MEGINAARTVRAASRLDAGQGEIGKADTGETPLTTRRHVKVIILATNTHPNALVDFMSSAAS